MDHSEDSNLTPRFIEARANMESNTLSGPLRTNRDTLVKIAEGMGMSPSQMDDYLGLKDGTFEKMVRTAPKDPPEADPAP